METYQFNRNCFHGNRYRYYLRRRRKPFKMIVSATTLVTQAKTTFVCLVVHIVGVEHAQVAGLLGGPTVSQGKELRQ